MTVIDENGTRHQVAPQVFEDLQARGLIWFDGQDHRIREGDTDMFLRVWLAVCDFCMARPVCWDADVASFTIADAMTFSDGHTGPYVSRGGWACCEACGALIAANDRDGLLNRHVSRAELGEAMRPILAVLHRRFWQHYRSIRRILPKLP